MRAALRARGEALVRALRAVVDGAVSTEQAAAAVAVLGLLGDGAALETILGAALLPELVAVVEEALAGLPAELAARAADVGVALGGAAATSALRWASRALLPADVASVVAAAWRAIDRGETGALAWEVVARCGSEADARSLARRFDALAVCGDPAEVRRVSTLLAARGAAVAERLVPGVATGVARGVAPRVAPGVASRESALEPAAPDAREVPIDAGAREASPAEGADGVSDDEALFAALETGPAHLRRAAARVLGWRGRRDDARLRAALADPDPGVVRAALGALGSATTLVDLAALTRHDDAEVAVDVLARLQRRDPARAAAAAVALLDHRAWSVRLVAVRTVDAGDAGTRARLEALRVYERDALVLDAVEQRLATAGRDGRSP